MTKQEFYAIAEDAASESSLHASYTLTAAQVRRIQFANAVMLVGIRERLGLRPIPSVSSSGDPT